MNPDTSAQQSTVAPAPLDTRSTLRAQRADVDDQKRRLSRLIGEYKKSGQSFEELLVEMKKVSAKLREIDQFIDELDHNPVQTPAAPTHSHLSEQSNLHINIDSISIVRADNPAWIPKWNAFVDGQSSARIYHRYEFRHIIETAFRQSCVYLAAIDTSGEIAGVLPATCINSSLFGNYIVSLPYFNYGGALGIVPAVEQLLIAELENEARALGVKHIEMRETAPRSGYPAKLEKVSMLLDLPSSIEQLWQSIGSKVRAQIKQAQGNDLRAVFGGAELLQDFYAVFAHKMRDLGTPVYGTEVFASLLEQPSLKGQLVVVYNQRTPVSCAFLLGYRNVLEIPWASTLQSANKLNANMYMYWHILSHAIEQGYSCFDFGRSSQDAGTYKFKKQWGAQPHQLYWHYWLKDGEELPQMNPNNPKYRLLIAIWRRLPVFVTRWIGPAIVRQLP